MHQRAGDVMWDNMRREKVQRCAKSVPWADLRRQKAPQRALCAHQDGSRKRITEILALDASLEHLATGEYASCAPADFTKSQKNNRSAKSASQEHFRHRWDRLNVKSASLEGFLRRRGNLHAKSAAMGVIPKGVGLPAALNASLVGWDQDNVPMFVI